MLSQDYAKSSEESPRAAWTGPQDRAAAISGWDDDIEGPRNREPRELLEQCSARPPGERCCVDQPRAEQADA